MERKLKPVTDARFLSDFLTDDLFLVADELCRPVEKKISRVRRAGMFAKRVLIISHFFEKKEELLLEKILGSINLGWEDVLLIQLEKMPSLDQLNGKYNPLFVVSLGVNALIGGWPVASFDPVTPSGKLTLFEGRYFLSTATLHQLADDPTKKAELWNDLKAAHKLVLA